MGKRCAWVAALVLVIAAVISEANSQTGGSSVDCFASTDCTGPPIVDASIADARTCCIGNGLSYDLMDGSGCQICNVHGFTVSSLTVSESGTPTNLVVMSGVKGTRLPIFFINSLEAVDITARREDGDFFFADVPATQIPVVVQTVLSFTAMGDSVAQEGNETFQIRIPTISPLPPGNFFRDTVTITITDDNFLSVQFTEVDYAIQEPGLTLPVQIRAVRLDGTSIDVGNPVTIRVTPLTYSQFEDRDIQLPPVFPTGPPTRPDDPAEVNDFDTSSFEVVLQPGQTTVDATIDVVDDAIDENREGFVAILEVVDAVDVSMIDLTQRQVTQCNIDDDDTIPELDLTFAGNTPRLSIGTINAELFSNRPGVQISCFLHRTSFIQDCSNGNVTFTNVPAGGYRLRVIATDRATGDTVEIRAKVFVPESDEFCSVNAINRLVSVSGNSATTEFISTGNPTGFLCRVDRQAYIPCTSPFTTTGLDSGGHHLRVRPRGCGRPRDGRKSLSVSFNV